MNKEIKKLVDRSIALSRYCNLSIDQNEFYIFDSCLKLKDLINYSPILIHKSTLKAFYEKTSKTKVDLSEEQAIECLSFYVKKLEDIAKDILLDKIPNDIDEFVSNKLEEELKIYIPNPFVSEIDRLLFEEGYESVSLNQTDYFNVFSTDIKHRFEPFGYSLTTQGTTQVIVGVLHDKFQENPKIIYVDSRVPVGSISATKIFKI